MLRSAVPVVAFFCFALAACGGGAVAPAKAPEAAAPPAASTPPAASSAPPEAAAPAKDAGLGPAPSGLLEPARECADYASELASNCSSKADFNERLATALAAAPAERNALLHCLEQAPEAPAGLVRTLRAELAPRGCADKLLGDAPNGAGVARDVADTQLALGVGARLFRSVRQPPLPKAPFSRDAFLKHFKEVLSPWIAAQAHAVDTLSQVGPRLNGYAKGVVAIEAGLADMRFVNVARAIELPDEMKKDPEVRETYLVELERALEPRVARGRDAALVGLGELSRQGVLTDARLNEARGLLSDMYAGRRIDALDKLLLPALAPAVLDTPALKLAAKLPAFYASKLFAAASNDDAKLLRARLEQGVPASLWLSASAGDAAKPAPAPSAAAPGNPELNLLKQHALFQLGQTYFWAEPFARAAAVETPATDASAALVAALAKVLAHGPRNAAALMLGATTLPPELRETAGVDALAKQKTPVAALAEFDAAYLRGLAPPANDPAFWKEQTSRYQRAQKKLDAPASKAAAELAKAAAAIEKELLKQPKP